MMTIWSWRKELQPLPGLKILRECAAGDDPVAAGLPRGDGKVLLHVREEADRRHVLCRLIGPDGLEQRQRLEAGGVEVEDEEVGGGLAQGFEQSFGTAGESCLDTDARGSLGDLAPEQKVFYGREDSSRHFRLRALGLGKLAHSTRGRCGILYG